jgi:hypothetical protein
MFSSYAAVQQDKQTAAKVFVFYPSNYDFQSKQSSMAIIREPETKGVVLKTAGIKVLF